MSTNDSEQSRGRTNHPLLQLQELLEESKRRETRNAKEKVHCPECGTTVYKDTIKEAVQAAEQHDDKRHGGDQITRVNGIPLPGEEVAEAAEDAIHSLKEAA